MASTSKAATAASNFRYFNMIILLSVFGPKGWACFVEKLSLILA
jgi:hypothetical protein